MDEQEGKRKAALGAGRLGRFFFRFYLLDLMLGNSGAQEIPI